jgi:hypothetical protein
LSVSSAEALKDEGLANGVVAANGGGAGVTEGIVMSV